MFVCPSCGLGAPNPGFCTEDGSPLEQSSDELLGQTVGVFRITRLIGRGGMGSVYLGVHTQIGSRVAIKVLQASHRENASLVERFFAEARAVNVIHHEGIVNVIDLALLPDGRPYIVMEYLDGAPLSAHIAARGALSIGAITALALEVLDALAAVHAHGITHRDLKPDNIFITTRGRAKVLDFGVAKLRPELSGSDAATATGALLGTPQYMSPEQALGKGADARSDVYAMGVILYEAVTGRRAFDADSLFELLRMQVEMTPPPPSTLRPDLPAPYEQVILRALSKDPSQRPRDAAELARALEAAAAGVSLDTRGPLAPLPAPTAVQGAPGPVRTAPGTSSTLGHTGAPATTGGGRGLILGLVGGAVAMLLLVGAVGVAFLAGMFTGTREGSSTASGEGTGSESSGIRPLRNRNFPVKADIKRLGITTALANATREARKLAPDAKLTTISAVKVKGDGTVDLTQGATLSFIYRTEKNASCMISVSHYQENMYVSEVNASMCPQAVREPACDGAVVMKRAFPAGAPSDGATISYTMHPTKGSTWYVIPANAAAIEVDDDC